MNHAVTALGSGFRFAFYTFLGRSHVPPDKLPTRTAWPLTARSAPLLWWTRGGRVRACTLCGLPVFTRQRFASAAPAAAVVTCLPGWLPVAPHACHQTFPRIPFLTHGSSCFRWLPAVRSNLSQDYRSFFSPWFWFCWWPHILTANAVLPQRTGTTLYPTRISWDVCRWFRWQHRLRTAGVTATTRLPFAQHY